MISRLATIVEQFVRVFTLRSARLGRLVGQRRRLIQIAAAAVAVTLGLWGWAINNPPANLGGWLDNIFRTAQLVTLQFPKSSSTFRTCDEIVRSRLSFAAASCNAMICLI
jgi:hypothetical protein